MHRRLLALSFIAAALWGCGSVATQNQAATHPPVSPGIRSGPKVKYAPNPSDFLPPNLGAQQFDQSIPVVVTTNKDGQVTKVIVLKPSIYPEFNEAAKELAMQVRYDPATINGDALETTLKFTIHFKLEDK